MARRFDIAIDCADPAALVRFWADALDYPREGIEDDPDNAGAMLEPPTDDLPRVFFQRVPEGKVAKNRLHVDVRVGGPVEERKARIDAEVARLIALGASDHRGPIAEGGSYWVRMNDPEGNEFCVVRG